MAMNNSMRLLAKLPKGSSKMFVRDSSHGVKQPIGGGVQLFPPGPRQIEQIKNLLPAAGMFGAVGFTLMCYFTDWKVTNVYIPFYGGKFKEDDE